MEPKTPPNPYESPSNAPIAESRSRPGPVKMTVMIILGTVCGLATIVYLVESLLILIRTDFSPRGFTEIGSALFALCIGALFTKWSFQSAFGIRDPEDAEGADEVVDMSLAPSATVTWLFIVLTPLTFWVPLAGPVIAWIGIRRARWVTMPDWIAFCLALLFFIAVIVTGGFVLFFGLPLLGIR
jgi:hypothetical protein